MNAVQLRIDHDRRLGVAREALPRIGPESRCDRCDRLVAGGIAGQPCDACCAAVARQLVAGDGLAAATVAAYRSSWTSWTAWTATHGRDAYPVDPDELGAWLVYLAASGTRWTTIRARLAAIRSVAARIGGFAGRPFDDHGPRLVLAGLRTRAATSDGGAVPIVRDELIAAVRAIDGGERIAAVRTRDRALLLVGWSIAARPSELAGMTWSDVRLPGSSGWPAGFVAVRRRKVGVVQEVPILRSNDPTIDPLAALEALHALGGDPLDPVFVGHDRHGNPGGRLTSRGVSDLVGRLLAAAGFPGRSGHGLRSGLVTTAARAGVPSEEIRRITGHATSRSLELYVKRQAAIDSGAARLL